MRSVRISRPSHWTLVGRWKRLSRRSRSSSPRQPSVKRDGGSASELRVRVISIIIPAHNEASVIGRCLKAFLGDANPDELEVIVACNGCVDATAEIARGFGPLVRVLELEAASKIDAINLGDAAAQSYPRFYVDADIEISMQSIRAIAAVLENGEALAAAPTADIQVPAAAPWIVKAYYRLWTSLPYVREGMEVGTVYAVSRKGRARFGRFPDVISDDGWFRLQFAPHERRQVEDARTRIWAPSTYADLIRIKSRHRMGARELRSRFPELFAGRAPVARYGGALLEILTRPRLWPYFPPYLWINAVSRWRAERQLRRPESYVWERDASTR